MISVCDGRVQKLFYHSITRSMFVACVYSDNVLQVLRAIRLTSVTQSVYFGFLSNGV